MGPVHIYSGDGKGKTTAAIGLSIRFAGSGGRVIFTQFLKNDASCELEILRLIPKILFIPSEKHFGFTRQMSSEIKKEALAHYENYFKKIIRTSREAASDGGRNLLVLDEIINADNRELVPHDLLISFLKNGPDNIEAVLTGRNPSPDLVEIADYVSNIQKIKHPYDKGVKARKGIEL